MRSFTTMVGNKEFTVFAKLDLDDSVPMVDKVLAALSCLPEAARANVLRILSLTEEERAIYDELPEAKREAFLKLLNK